MWAYPAILTTVPTHQVTEVRCECDDIVGDAVAQGAAVTVWLRVPALLVA